MFHSSHDLMCLLAQNNTLSSDTFPYIQCHISHYHSAKKSFAENLREITDEQQL